MNGLNLYCYCGNEPISILYDEYKNSILMFSKGHQGNMKSSKYIYWTTEELLARFKELSRKGHLTAEEKRKKRN